ncbi:MAG: hypothetical protein EBR82_25325 [Caulobacteraceae bacterium]|nr:hypothetical protein [Caulobacteraceae bacterium]
MTDAMIREINSTGPQRLAKARGIPVPEAAAWIELASLAFRWKKEVPNWRESREEMVQVSHQQ